MKTAVYSTRLNQKKRSLLKDIHQKTWFSERQILEKAIDLFNQKLIQEKIEDSYKNIWNDQENIKLTELWIENLFSI